MIVAMPSKGRAGRITTPRILPSVTAFVPANEVQDYEREHLHVIGVPEEVRGITRTRNWILDYANGEDVVFVDDDVKVAGWFELLSHNAKQRRLTEAEWLREFGVLFDVMRGMGFRIWGVATDGALRSVYPYRPFITRTYVTASLMGMVSDSLRFDETFPVKEDYELCLRCLKEDGGVLGARYLFWKNAHWDGEGGCVSYRTERMEAAAIGRLVNRYPGWVKQITRGGSRYSLEVTV